MAHFPDPHRPQVLYTVSLVWWMRLLSIALALVLELAIGVPVLLALLGGDGRMMLAGLIVLPLLIAVPVITLLANLQRFTVSTAGITIRGWLGRRRIPWDEVAVVEVDRSVLGRGATVVLTRDGRRVRSELTAARYALRRGESASDHGPDLLQPARPTRAAIQAHQEHLRRRHPGAPR